MGGAVESGATRALKSQKWTPTGGTLIKKGNMKKLRLLLFDECHRACVGCCNKDWDLDKLPICYDYTPYDEIILTGGEPLLYPIIIEELVPYLRKVINPNTKIYLYTAYIENTAIVRNIITLIDGICITLHEQKDVEPFRILVSSSSFPGKSLRLNVFRGVHLGDDINTAGWKVKDNIEWIKDCPLPEDEVFMRL